MNPLSSKTNPTRPCQSLIDPAAYSEAPIVRSFSMTKVMKKVAYTGMIATLVALMSTVCSASAVWGS
jgi:hypothetical protein